MIPFDVVIVGLGPVGATLANILGQAGIKVCVLEKESSVYHLPRAVQFDDEVMRVFQNIGLAESILKTTRFNPGMRFIDAAGNTLLDWPRPTGVSRQGWHTSYRFHQPQLEHILREGLKRFANVTVRSNCLVEQLEQNADHARVTFTDQQNNLQDTINCQYIVGCDGANSPTRDAMATSYKNLGFNERWLVVDALLKKPMPQLGDFSVQYCVPERPATYVRGPENRRRWELTVHDDEPSDDVSQPGRVWEMLAQWITPEDAELERIAVYTFESAVAQQWCKGRMMVAGDAAHLTPPFMGQGMCAGIRDVSNLAWKLVLCCRATCGRSLLDTYQLEREPHVTEYIETAIRLGKLINSSGNVDSLQSVMQQSNGSSKMQILAPRLGSALHSADTTHTGTLSSQPEIRSDDPGNDESGNACDDLRPNLPLILVDQQLLHEHQGRVSSGDNTPDNPPGAVDANAWPISVISSEDQPSIKSYLNELDCKAVFIRPDRYILGSANNPREFGLLLDSLAQLQSEFPQEPLPARQCDMHESPCARYP